MKKLALILLFVFASVLVSTVFAADPRVKLETSHGDIILQLNVKAAPETVANFVIYVEDGFYDGTIFHRVIRDFMIQGGGLTPDMKEKKTRGAIKNEADNGLKNVRGSVTMARKRDPHSATAQFFINTVDNDYLDFTAANTREWGYAVFGKVVEGMDTVDKIQNLRTGIKHMFRDAPIDTVIIKKASLIQDTGDE